MPVLKADYAMSLEEISQKLGLSKTFVRWLEQNAMRKIKESGEIGNLLALAALCEQMRAGRQRVEIRK